jgi:hypothetical protein
MVTTYFKVLTLKKAIVRLVYAVGLAFAAAQ